MCLLCAEGVEDRGIAERAHVLDLLALIEHPDALPAEAALRLGREIMMRLRPTPAPRRCESVAPPGQDIEETV